MKASRAVLLAAVAALGTSLAGAQIPENIVSILERFDHLTVGEAKLVGPLTLSAGHLECRLASGRAAPVLAGDEVVGIFFDGNGTLEYVSADPLEAPVVLFNTRKASSLKAEKTEKGIRIRDSFARALWLAQGQPVPPLDGPAAPSVAAAFAKQRDKFRRILGPSLAHDFAVQKLDAPAAPLVRAEFEGGRDDIVYDLQVEDPTEIFSVLRKTDYDDPELHKYVFRTNLSVQRLARSPKDPPKPRVMLADVDVDLRASTRNNATMTVIETLVPLGRPMSALRMDLARTVYTFLGNNLTTRTEHLRKVTDEAGRSLAFRHADDEVVIQLAEVAAPEKPLKLKFEIDGDFLVSPAGDSYWELGISDWFPQPSLAGQFYTFHATVRVKKPFVPFAPGKTVRRATDGDDNLLETRVDKPICFAVILAGDYTVQEEVRNGITIRVATYALDNPRAVKQLTNLAATIIEYYQEFLGPFPLPEFNIIEINDIGWGQAPPGTMFITKEAFNPIMTAHTGEGGSRGFNEVFAHEIAHQYWGVAVKMPSDEEQWLTESFAEYCSALFMKAYKNEAAYKAMVRHWRGRATFGSDEIPIPLANDAYVSSDPATRYFIRSGLLYNKGPMLLYALHKELGDEAFFTFLKSYQKSFAWKSGSTRMMAGLLQYMTKKDYMPFFDKYYWGTEMPKD